MGGEEEEEGEGKEEESSNESAAATAPIVFMDMGSGVGRLVVQAYMELPRITKAIGIELAKFRHENALLAWDDIEVSARNVRRAATVLPHCLETNSTACMVKEEEEEATVEFVEGDIFDADISQITHLYVASLCFSDEMMLQLGHKINREGKNLQCVATLTEFPREDFEWKGIKDSVSYEI